MKTTFEELQKNLKRDFLLRRYQKLSEGEVPFEDLFFETVAHFWTALKHSWRRMTKRALDLFVATAMLIFGSPVMLLVAIAVKVTSPGPVLYSQVRVGKKGKTFKMYKFRSMRQDAELKSGPVWAQENDPRVTPLGLFLRKTHLDELPQLFNVFRGDMSLVGPRPERPHFVKQLRKEIPHYDKRHYAKPGVTGLAQVRQRYDENIQDVKRKVRYDVLYIKKMCPLLDLKVIALTALTVIFKTGR